MNVWIRNNAHDHLMGQTKRKNAQINGNEHWIRSHFILYNKFTWIVCIAYISNTGMYTRNTKTQILSHHYFFILQFSDSSVFIKITFCVEKTTVNTPYTHTYRHNGQRLLCSHANRFLSVQIDCFLLDSVPWNVYFFFECVPSNFNFLPLKPMEMTCKQQQQKLRGKNQQSK